jgi:hypothetical protein
MPTAGRATRTTAGTSRTRQAMGSRPDSLQLPVIAAPHARPARLRLPEANPGGDDPDRERTPAVHRRADRRRAGPCRVAAAGTIGAGAIGAIQETLGQAHDTLVGVVPCLDSAKWGLLAVTLIGLGVMLWARIACADGSAARGLAASPCPHPPGMVWRRGWRGRGAIRRPAGRPQCRACREHAADGGGAACPTRSCEPASSRSRELARRMRDGTF